VKISFVEIQNFRKLKSTHIDFDKETTLFVGANNSGKTSAMVALRYFLVTPSQLSLRDLTLSHWSKIDAIGVAWEQKQEGAEDLTTYLPALDVWLDVPASEIHHVVHILPTINWTAGLIGVRLQYEPEDFKKLKEEYLVEKGKADTLVAALAAVTAPTSPAAVPTASPPTPRVWPRSLTEFLGKRISDYVVLNAYSLDPSKITPVAGQKPPPQKLTANALPLEKWPFSALIRIDEISAHSDFANNEKGGGVSGESAGELNAKRTKKPLSDQLRVYYDKHLDPSKSLSVEDVGALGAIQVAEKAFDDRLKSSFKDALNELEDLGYPGINNPKIRINTQLRATDGLRHGSAVEYEIADLNGDGRNSMRLPEAYSGLGYQRLISMVFMLMGFRDEWMRKHKTVGGEDGGHDKVIPPLHFVLVEEPEAHLHAQVQQVFIKKAYSLLRKHESLGSKADYSTQLVVSTHSSHVAHEADFASLRYFRRRHAETSAHAPTTTVTNLAGIFGGTDATHRFVKRYLKATHCDLFFADAAIFVEGQAERILVPHFIRHYYPDLASRYVSLLDLGGSHAHSFKELIVELGITTLVISDLDAVIPTQKTRKDGVPTTTLNAAKPQKGLGQKTANPVLKSWHPKLELIDQLLALAHDNHITPLGDDCNLFVAYQKGIELNPGTPEASLFIPRTFEDALIYENKVAIGGMAESSLGSKVGEIIAEGLDDDALADALFELLKSAEKAAFALDCLMVENPKLIKPPTYIREGLSWLQASLNNVAPGQIQETAS
jgi:predicted ATP-dependent endonuclease of OLD family